MSYRMYAKHFNKDNKPLCKKIRGHITVFAKSKKDTTCWYCKRILDSKEREEILNEMKEKLNGPN